MWEPSQWLCIVDSTKTTGVDEWSESLVHLSAASSDRDQAQHSSKVTLSVFNTGGEFGINSAEF